MLQVTPTWRFTVANSGDRCRWMAHVNLVQRELEALGHAVPELVDQQVILHGGDAADFGDGTTAYVQITVTVTGDSATGALSKAEACVRSAIHAGGGSTPGWDDRAQTNELRKAVAGPFIWLTNGFTFPTPPAAHCRQS